jgi:hypothetical protein
VRGQQGDPSAQQIPTPPRVDQVVVEVRPGQPAEPVGDRQQPLGGPRHGRFLADVFHPHGDPVAGVVRGDEVDGGRGDTGRELREQAGGEDRRLAAPVVPVVDGVLRGRRGADQDLADLGPRRLATGGPRPAPTRVRPRARTGCHPARAPDGSPARRAPSPRPAVPARPGRALAGRSSLGSGSARSASCSCPTPSFLTPADTSVGDDTHILAGRYPRRVPSR